MDNQDNLLKQAMQFHQSGEIVEAISLYRKILESERGNPQVHFLLGAALFQAGMHEEAVACMLHSIKLQPNPVSYSNLGVMYSKLKQWAKATECFETSVKINPEHADGHCYLGTALRETKQFKRALNHLNKAVELAPDHALAHYNLATTLHDLGLHQDAICSFGRSIELAPNFPDAYAGYGVSLFQLGQIESALSFYDKAISLAPDHPEYFYNKAKALGKLRKFPEALSCYERAITLKPDYIDAYANQGLVLLELNCLEEALVSEEMAINLDPNYAEAYGNRGVVLQELKRFEDALESYKKAYEIKPDIDCLLGSKLHVQMHLCEWINFDNEADTLATRINEKFLASPPFVLLSVLDAPLLQKTGAETYVAQRYPKAQTPLFSSASSDYSKIKVGYFSSDFTNHATMHLMAELFECHDKKKFEFTAFSLGQERNDPWRQRAQSAFDEFIICHKKTDAEIAELARKLGVDIAVDLKGFTQGSRTGIFAHRAAPIQVNFLGYPGTMGAEYMDYLIADEVLIPEESREYYSEKIAYLPHSYQPNCRVREIAEQSAFRSHYGLPDRAVVLGAFNNNCKITPQIFSSWMRILQSVEGSVLWVLVSNSVAECNLKKYADECGVGASRLIFAKPLPIEEHLGRIGLADLMLDTFPYGGHTTCSDALRVGLPVVTMMGESFASRVAASLLTTAGCPELITNSVAEYESLAIDLARDLQRLNKIREDLWKNKEQSPLYNPNLFARNLELLYQAMYVRHSSRLPVDHIFIN